VIVVVNFQVPYNAGLHGRQYTFLILRALELPD
jgi:hypothetical protein